MDKISYKIKYKKKLVWTTISGSLDYSTASAIVTETRKIAENKNCTLFLYDLRQVNLNIPVYQLYALPREFTVVATHRTAAIIKEETPDLADWQFLENVEVNIGLQIQLFFDEKEAIKWLLQEEDQ
jgi:hypothetical protein